MQLSVTFTRHPSLAIWMEAFLNGRFEPHQISLLIRYVKQFQ